MEKIDDLTESKNLAEIDQQNQPFYSPNERKVNIHIESSYFSAPIKPKVLFKKI